MSRLLVTLADGSEIEHALSKRMTLGSGGAADVRLAGEDLEGEHLLLVPQRDGCWIATARGARTPLLRDGAVVPDGLVPWGTKLTLGGSTLDVGGRGAAAASSRMRPVLLALALVVVALFALSAVRSRAARAAALVEAPSEPASLFTEPRPCAVEAREAYAEAAESLRAARARGERFHYDYQDGIAAVSEYEHAEACFLVAGAVPWAERASAEGRALREEIESTERRLRLALQQQLARGEDAAALAALRELRELRRHHDDALSAELAELERELQLELGLLVDESAERE